MENLLEYEGLVYSIINKYSTKFDRDDLYQVGMIGLLNAYKHYNEKYETKFSSFAYYYIIGEINKYIRDNNSLKVSKDIINLKKKILQTKEIMTQKLGRIPTNLEISLFLEIDINTIDKALLLTENVDSLDNKDYDITKTYDNTSAEIMDLKLELEKLPEEEKKLILMRYYKELTQSEASNILGISQVQISRKETKILQKLKSKLTT